MKIVKVLQLFGLADCKPSTLGLFLDFLKDGLNWEGVLTGDTMARGAIGKVMLSNNNI